MQEIAGVVPTATVEAFARVLGVEVTGTCMEVDGAGRAPSFEGVRNEVRQLMRGGWGASQLLSQVSSWFGAMMDDINDGTRKLHDLIMFHPSITSLVKSRCALAFAEADKALCDGADEELWILEVALRVWKAVI